MGLDKMLVINSKRCTGCRLCELACSFWHTGKACPSVFQPSVSRIKVRLFSKEGYSVPGVCLQCQECYCITACDAKAMHKNEETGAIEIDESLCIGCKACLSVCPYEGMGYDFVRDKAIVCDLCRGDPECVKYCFSGAIQWVDIDSVPFVREDYVKAIKGSASK